MKGLRDPLILQLTQDIAQKAYKDLKAGEDVDLDERIIEALTDLKRDVDFTFIRLLVSNINEQVALALFKDLKDKTFRFRAANAVAVATALGVPLPDFSRMRKDITFDHTRPWWQQMLPEEGKKAESAPSLLPTIMDTYKPKAFQPNLFNKVALYAFITVLQA